MVRLQVGVALGLQAGVGVSHEIGPAFAELVEAGLVRSYAPGEVCVLPGGLRCLPFPVRHDGGASVSELVFPP